MTIINGKNQPPNGCCFVNNSSPICQNLEPSRKFNLWIRPLSNCLEWRKSGSSTLDFGMLLHRLCLRKKAWCWSTDKEPYFIAFFSDLSVKIVSRGYLVDGELKWAWKEDEIGRNLIPIRYRFNKYITRCFSFQL